MNRQQRRAAMKQGGPAAPGVAPNVPAIFAEGRRRHNSGRLQEAEHFYRQVLAVDPRHADALHMLGIIDCDLGRHDRGIDLIGRAIAINPRVAQYHFTLATAHQDKVRRAEAIVCYRRAIALEPRYLEALSNLGCLLKEEGRLDEAIDCHRRALALQPNVAESHNNLGIALQGLGLLDDAVASYRRALALKADHPQALSNLGNALKDQNKLAEACDCYRKAVALKPDFHEARNNLALALQDQGRFADAIAVYETALRLGSDAGLCYFGLSACRKFTAEDHPLIARMNAALQDRKMPDNSRSLLHFALGKVFDDLRDYETAMGHFDAANRLARAGRVFDRARFTALVDRIIAESPDFTKAAPVVSESELPVLIVGMPRSGTTLVEQILASHPQVAAGGELEFWSRRFDRDSPGQVQLSAVPDYLALLRRYSPDALRVTDKMPFNFLFLGQAHALFPKGRIVHCRRSPLDTALSIYFTHFSGSHDFAYRREDIVHYYRGYLRLMEHWRTVLPPDRFIEIDYEALVADQEAVSRRLVAFCGLDWDEAVLDFHGTDRPIMTASAWQARQPVYRSSTERWRNYEPWLGELRQLLPENLGHSRS
jgi:tetratricopeptide (TPR) repeat protein